MKKEPTAPPLYPDLSRSIQEQPQKHKMKV